MSDTARRPVVATLFAVALSAVAACSAAAPASPSPTPARFDSSPSAKPVVTASPIVVPVASPGDAAARVLVLNPLFSGAEELRPDVIGASKWWEAKPLDGGGYLITVTVGWGDCPAGCISRHTWTYAVLPDGAVEPRGETGDPVPSPM